MSDGGAAPKPKRKRRGRTRRVLSVEEIDARKLKEKEARRREAEQRRRLQRLADNRIGAQPAQIKPSAAAVKSIELHEAPSKEAIQAAYVTALKRSLPLFAQEVLGMQMSPHLLEWGDLINNHPRVSINAARGHGKSAFFSYAYAIWRAWSEPGVEVYLFSATLDQAKEFLDIIIYGRDRLRGMIDIPELAHLVPTPDDMRRDKRLRLNKEDVKFTNLSRIKCVGYGKKIRGRHPKYIVLDDVLNDEDMYSELVRRKHIDYYKSAISPMVTPDGQIVAVGTPYHGDDLYYGFLRHNPQYVFRRYPGLIRDKKTGKERPLFPWLWTIEKLEEKKKEIGTVAFTREILVSPVSDEMAIFPSTLFPPLYDKTLLIRPDRAKRRALGIEHGVFIGVDFARSANTGADWFVIFVIGKDKHGTIYVLDIIRRKGYDFQKQISLIEMVSKRYSPQLVFIESNAAQQILSSEVRRTTSVPVKEFVTTAQNKYPLDKGVPGLRILMENNKLVIPYGKDELMRTRGLMNAWMFEMQQFGFIDGKLQGIGSHDDQVMAFWFAVEASKHGGFNFDMGGGGEGDGDDDEGAGEDWQSVLMGNGDDEPDDAL
jgi:hypothetical protein